MATVSRGHGLARGASVSGSAGFALGFGEAAGEPVGTVYVDGLMDQLFLHQASSYHYGTFLTSGIGHHLASSYQWQAGGILVETLRFHEAALAGSKYKQTLSVPMLFHDAIVRGFPATLTGGLGLHLLGVVVQAVQVVSALRLHDNPGALAHFTQAVLENLRFHDKLLRFLGGSLTSGIGLHEAPSRTFQALPTLAETMGLGSVLGRVYIVRVDIADGADFDDSDILKTIYKGDVLEDGIQLSAAYVDPGGGFATWAINTRTGAVTEYDNYTFQSMCKFGHRYLGATSTGLWALDGELDDTASIPSRIKAGWMQLAGSRFTSFKAAYLGLRVKDTTRDFILKLHAGDGREYIYAVKPQNMMTTKVNMGKGLRSRYFAFELITDGPDYDLDSVEFVPIMSTRRV